MCSLLQTAPSPFSLDRIARVCLTLKQSPLPPFSFLVISTRPVRPVFPTSLRTSLKQPVHTQRSQSHPLCQFCAVSRARVPPSVISSSPGLPQAGFDPHRWPLADAWCRGCPVKRMSELVCACCCASREYACCLAVFVLCPCVYPPFCLITPITLITLTTLMTLMS